MNGVCPLWNSIRFSTSMQSVLAEKKKYVPALAVGGGFTFEDQIFKGLAMGAPFVKLVGMARGPIAAAMVGKTIGRAIENQRFQFTSNGSATRRMRSL